MSLLDCHTHVPGRWVDAIVSCAPDEFARFAVKYPDAVFSVGIHPWATAGADVGELERQFRVLRGVAGNRRVFAIGEAGLDGLRGAADEVQQVVLRKQIELSEAVGKPLIVHCVRRYGELLGLQRDMRPVQPWIWHGFRGKPELALQLLRASDTNYISLGERFNPATAQVIPSGRLFVETDESALCIAEIMERIAAARNEPAAVLADGVAAGLMRLRYAVFGDGYPCEGDET